MGLLEGQTAVVTGAGRGLGRAIALRLAAEGAGVACLSRTAANAERTAQAVRDLGQQAWSRAVDVADPEAVNQAAAAIQQETERTDILVNNAGITRDGLLLRLKESDWNSVLDTNLRSAFLFVKAFTRRFMKQRHGRIVNIGSVVGQIGNPGQINYAASKAGLIGLTKSAARELASRGVTANVVAPGFIATDMTGQLTEDQRSAILERIPLGTLGDPEDIAQTVLFLAGPHARYVTGQVLGVDGGLAM